MMSSSGKQDLKVKLQNKAQSALGELITLEKSVLKNCKSKDLISQFARSMVQQEAALDTSLNTLMKMQMVLTHLHYQADSITQSLAEVEPIKYQLDRLASQHPSS
ncbi:BLOC-1-related complex subunit 7-like [Watersipora subatra]|uniref:BLOC-1-related complex subunit 7-like n=1 Tax=Watersipora subatra TaxID=2589382 RepID=UPI00355AE993